jgi:hypothetical protein
MLTDHEAQCAAAYVGVRDWPTHAGVPAWEATARLAADKSLGCVLAFGGTQRQASKAWMEAFTKARETA